MTLPNEEVLDLLRDRFVVGWRNIERESHVGLSHGYKPDQTAVGTTNGAGGRNVQLVVLAADETVLHVMPGYWHAEDLVNELRLALELHQLHCDDSVGGYQKLAMFRALHRSFLNRLSAASLARSDWQGFDRHEEGQRGKKEKRDTFVLDEKGEPVPGRWGLPELKPVVQVVHERLMARPFRKLGDFGMESFVDYGRAYYDNNMGLDKGRNFQRAAQANAKREKERAKAEKDAAKGQAKG